MTTWATYKGQSYKVKGKKTVVPNFDEMDSFAVHIWMVKNTYARGYAAKTNPLAGMGRALSVQVQ